MGNFKKMSRALLGAGLIAGAFTASAAVSKVICVPWQGDTTKYHTTLAGGGGRLKAVIKTDSTATHHYKWVYGDGTPDSAVQALSGNTWYTVEDTHAYAGAAGTPFTAQLVVADNSGLTTPTTDSYLVKIEANNLDARINVAIDEGLWYTYKAGTRGDGTTGSFATFDLSPLVYWTSGGHYAASTASAVQSFEINGSKESGDFDQDPYAEYVYRGLKFLIMGYSNGSPSVPVLRSLTLSLQHGDDPDSNGNGIGIEAYDLGNGQPVYQGGQVMDALIASGTPAKSSGRDFVGGGTPHVATYAEIIQDMADMYAWGQFDGTCSVTVTDQGIQNLTSMGTPISITFEMLDYSCGGGGTYNFFINGVNVGTSTPQGCSCSQTHTVVISGASLTSAWTATIGKNLGATYTGGYLFSRMTATVDFGGGNVRSLCVKSQGPDCFTSYACSYYTDAAFDVTVDLSSVNSYLIETICSPEGAWIYGWNEGPIDNSSSQWAAIGMIPAQEPPWNAVVPAWVKSHDEAAVNTTHSQQNSGLWGGFGYRDTGGIGPYVADGATSPSGLVQLSFAGVTTSDARWVRTERRFAENWDSGQGWFSSQAKNNLYGMYAFTKAMRLAKPSPVVNLAYNGLDWYRGSVTQEGVAKALSDNLIANNGQYSVTYWAGNPLETIWAVIMLKPALFAASPIACFTAHPNPAYSDLPISFEPFCSGHSEPGKGIANLVKFEWDWDNNGTFDESSVTPVATSHTFHCDTVPCAFPVTLKVTDDTGLTATFVQTINITDPPHPPVSRSKAVFWVSQCEGDTLTLDGSASFDPDEGLHQAGCLTCPNDTITAWDWDFNGAPFDYTSEHGKIVNLGAAWSTHFPTVGATDIGLRVTDNTALAYPASMQPNLTDENFSRVLVFAAGQCDLAATADCDSVNLSWSSTATATSYEVYRSLTGANADFVLVATTVGTTADVGATFMQNQWFRVIAKTPTGDKMSKAAFAKLTAEDCVCITNLKAAAKNKLVQLTWSPQAGATCYNVYRSTAADVLLIAGNRIAACVVTGVAVYNDTAVVNGTKYYYRVTKVVNGEETCISNKVNATPALPRGR